MHLLEMKRQRTVCPDDTIDFTSVQDRFRFIASACGCTIATPAFTISDTAVGVAWDCGSKCWRMKASTRLMYAEVALVVYQQQNIVCASSLQTASAIQCPHESGSLRFQGSVICQPMN